MRALSRDLRERIVRADLREEGSTGELAARFAVAPATVRRLRQQYRRLGHVENLPHPPKPMKLAAYREPIERWVAEEPGLTLAELVARLRARHRVRVGLSTVHNALARWGLSLKKKTLKAAEQLTPRIAAARTVWAAEAPEFDPKRLVFFDESAAQTNLTRLYGRAPLGTRCVDHAPVGDVETYTLLAAVRLEGPIEAATLLLDGPVNGALFTQYLEQALGPQLHAGDILILDNLSAHKGMAVQQVIEARGAHVQYLPPYSPDFNPIEKLLAKLKAAWRHACARTLPALTRTARRTLRTVTPTECLHYFQSCGYALPNVKTL